MPYIGKQGQIITTQRLEKEKKYLQYCMTSMTHQGRKIWYN